MNITGEDVISYMDLLDIQRAIEQGCQNKNHVLSLKVRKNKYQKQNNLSNLTYAELEALSISRWLIGSDLLVTLAVRSLKGGLKSWSQF